MADFFPYLGVPFPHLKRRKKGFKRDTSLPYTDAISVDAKS